MSFRRICHGLTDSTSERAFAALEAGLARDRDVHLALGQSRGRGRLGRAWVSAPGAGLYMSVVLLPSRPLPPAGLTFAGGLAVLDAVRALGVAGARLCWPNDVLVGEAKLSGVLAETRGLTPDRPHYVLGIGLNVAQRAFPEELTQERAVTSLALCGARGSVQEAERLVLDCLERRLEEIEREPERLAREALAATGLAGQRVRVRAGSAEVLGRWTDLCLLRGLRLESEEGGGTWLQLELVRKLAPA